MKMSIVARVSMVISLCLMVMYTTHLFLPLSEFPYIIALHTSSFRGVW